MKFEANAKQFKESWARVARVIPKTTPNPILQSALLSAEGDAVRLSATSINISISVALDDVTIHAPGRVLLPRQFVDRLLTAAESDTLVFDGSDADKLSVRGLSGRWVANTEHPDLFPSPDTPGASCLVLCAADLKLAIKRAVVATDEKATRYALGGCCFVPADGDSIRLVATDGRRIAVARVAWLSGQGLTKVEPVVPRALLELVAGAIEDETTEVEVGFTDSSAYFRVGPIVLSGRLVEGRFPRWQECYPPNGSSQGSAKLDAGAFRRLVAGAAVSTSEESQSVEFTFGEPDLFGSAGAGLIARGACETSRSEAQIPAEYSGKPTTLRLLPGFLLDGIRAVEGEIEWVSVADRAANVFRVPNFEYILAPVSKE